MSNLPSPVSHPELIVGMAGPIGVDMDRITNAIAAQLDTLGYRSIPVKLTAEMRAYGDGDPPVSGGKFAEYWWKMDYANNIRRSYNRSDILARIAIDAIRRERRKITSTDGSLERHAYLVRQLKHPDEVKLLRKVYGRQFILVSAFGSEDNRTKRLWSDVKLSESTSTEESKIAYMVAQLIERDASEVGESLGQQLRDTFHLADVFIDGISIDRMKNGIERFFNAFFGRADITPSKDEYAMYAAKSASLRSSDLSRQVGAVIFSKDGEIVTQGCNEVPKANGGTYWDGEAPDYRDMRVGYDPNDRQKREVIRDTVERLRVAGFLSESILSIGNDTTIVSNLIAKKSEEQPAGALSESRLMDITEFGRVVHAEMCAICDAARLGKSTKATSLYCTTFPCHNCTKHIIAAGIERVVYLEPYPKSKARELHENEIEMDSENDDAKVSFVPFMGISPHRYRDMFQKGRRKANDGTAELWIDKAPRPMLDIEFPGYVKTSEVWALYPLVGSAENEPASAAPDAPHKSDKGGVES